MIPLSVVIPFNESDLIIEVLEEVRSILSNAEIIAVDDGSTDDTRNKILSCSGIRLLQLGKNCVQSAALYAGLRMGSFKVSANLLFSSRWLIQMAASRASGRPVLPRLFWYMSMAGSVCLLLYFIFGKNDSVGIFSNLFPFTVAFYNLTLDLKHHKRN